MKPYARAARIKPTGLIASAAAAFLLAGCDRPVEEAREDLAEQQLESQEDMLEERADLQEELGNEQASEDLDAKADAMGEAAEEVE